MIVVTHTIGNSETLQKIFAFEWDENYDNLCMLGKDIIGSQIETKTEILQ